MPAISGDLGANEIIRLLNMQPHPEGGHYVETFRAPSLPGHRPTSTLIHFLLQADEVSAWHRVDADEVWLWHAGGPLVLTTSPPDGRGAATVKLGPDLRGGQSLQGIVPAHHWQTAETLGAWTLVSCTVAPGFDFKGFELAPPGWRPIP
ncbi:MAG: cupin domain-containing protein [Hyphomonas sp.]|uniref:cupin domain-containing protein n=1 Tax=Hyphomonas sp. TaxID=87 RepID=UPI0035270D6B